MKALKVIWFLINVLAALFYFVVYIYFTWSLFFPPYSAYNLTFIALFAILVLGFVESFISCACKDEADWRCWVSLFFLSIAILSLYLVSLQMYEEISSAMSNGEAAGVVVGLLLLVFETIVSPTLVSKYSSWVLLFIGFIDKRTSKVEWLFPISLLIINIAGDVIISNVGFGGGWGIAYIIVFLILGVVSLVVTIQKAN